MGRASPLKRQPAADRTAPIAGTDERALAARLRSGNPEAIEQLHRTYFDRLYRLVFHSVRRDQAAAEDIVQDVFLSAIRSARGFEGNSMLYTWLVGIARHKTVDYYRDEQKEAHHEMKSPDDAPTGLKAVADHRSSIADDLESIELKDAVAEALAALPLDYRQVLLLKYVEGMTIPEIGQVLKRSAKAIDGLLTRARQSLRENLSGDMRGKTHF